MSAIETGSTLPEATFTVMGADGPAERSSAEIFGGRKVALVAVPGAFTGTCSNTHIPGFMAQADALKAKGVDEIVCLSVNDVFVMDAWEKSMSSGDDITMLADGSAMFTKAAGMELDLTARGMGVRSKRYAALIDDGVVKSLLIETSPGVADESSAEALLNTM